MKLGIIVSGWHFPLHFYKSISEQALPDGWEADLFCVSHRNPKHAKPEVKKYISSLGDGLRADLDRRLYEKVASITEIKKLGWEYMEEPNTVGDWGNTNQWLDKHDYTKYDAFLFSHDDNLIINPTMLYSVLKMEDWDIITNSTGMPPGSIRGSFEFFKKPVLDILGGKFDLSEVSLTREGKTETPQDINSLYDWNATVYPLSRTVQENKLKVIPLSPCYRVSMFCIEGERGFISKTHGSNTQYEEEGLKILKENKLI